MNFSILIAAIRSAFANACFRYFSLIRTYSFVHHNSSTYKLFISRFRQAFQTEWNLILSIGIRLFLTDSIAKACNTPDNHNKELLVVDASTY